MGVAALNCRESKQVMKHSQHCLLGVTRIRRVFLCLGFSFLVLWILLGNYNVDQGPRANWKKTKATEISNGTLRKLMQADDGQEKFDPNGTNEDVEVSIITSLLCYLSITNPIYM